MTKLILSALLFCFFATAASAGEQAEARRFCDFYRRSSVKNQTRMARASGYSRERVLASCRLINQKDSPYRPAPGRSNGERQCSGSVQCHPSQHCVNRRCEDRLRQSCSERGRDQCSAGEKCVRGRCEG